MEIYSLFGHILEPPGPGFRDRVDECIALLTPFRQEAADLMKGFKTFVEQTPPRRIEKIHEDTFSLEGACYPYVGYQLFGDGSHRRLFLDGLKELYQSYGSSAAQETPDHLGVMLKFLAEGGDEEALDEMVSLYVIPSLRRMLKGCEGRGTPYEEVLRALLLVLKERVTAQDGKMAPERAKESYLAK